MITPITATFPALNFPKEVDYPTQEDWAAFSAAAELNYGILSGAWSDKSEEFKEQINNLALEIQEIGENAINAISLAAIEDLATYSGTGLVIVKDINRGGIFISKTEIDIDPNTGSLYTVNGGTVFAKSDGGFWVRQYSGAVNVKWFGAKGDGITDDTAAIQLALDSNTIIYIPNGIFLLDTITFIDPTGLYASRGSNIFGMLFINSNNIIYGDGTIKVADNILLKSYVYSADQYSGTYLGYQMPGAKGFQVFVQKDISVTLANVAISDITIDLNGYNNKVYGLNSFGNQTQCHAVYFENSDNCSINNVIFKDHSGSQCISLGSNCINSKIIDNTFMDAGMLDGTNTLLDDHSTIYSLGYNTLISGNKLTQTIQWTQKGGAPIEVHNKAVVTNNMIDKYAACGVIAALILDGEFNISNNTYTNISAIGYDVYNQSGHSLKCDIENNTVEILKLDLLDTHPAYQHRNFIVSTSVAYSPGISNININKNTIKMIGSVEWVASVVDSYNSFIHSQLITTLTITNNIIDGFRGGIFDLSIQQSSSGIVFSDNNIISCGNSHDVKDYNAIVNYYNNSKSDYGTTLYNYYSYNNNYIGCMYSTYFSFNQVAGVLLAPSNIDINNDNHSIWIGTTQTSSVVDISDYSQYNWNISYNVSSNLFTAKEKLKLLPSVSKNLSKAQYGSIKLTAGGLTRNFIKVQGINTWACIQYSYGDTSPVLNEVSPFSYSYNGDTKYVVNPSAGGHIGWICTADGSPGTWKPFGTISG